MLQEKSELIKSQTNVSNKFSIGSNRRIESAPIGRAFCCCTGRFQYVILLLTMCCVVTISANMIAFNFTIILMRKPNTANTLYPIGHEEYGQIGQQQQQDDNELLGNEQQQNFLFRNGTHAVPITVPFTPSEKARLLYAVGLGSMASTFVFSELYTRHYARWAFFAAGIISACATAILPSATLMGMPIFVAVRFMQGIAYGANFAIIGFVCHRWASINQHGFFLACLTSFTPISVTLTNPMAAIISAAPSLGWPWVYYILAICTVLAFCLWLALYREQPDEHFCVQITEILRIQTDKSADEILCVRPTPYRKIITNKHVLLVWINAYTAIMTGLFMITYMPTYMSKVLRFGVRETGIWSAAPTLALFPLKIFFGWLSDKITCMSQLKRMKMFNTIALALPGTLYALVGFVPDHLRGLSVAMMVMNLSFLAANPGGFYKCATLISRQYAHFVVAVIQFVKSITLCIAPIIFQIFIADESSKEQWQNIFLCMALLLISANVLFICVATDQPAQFTKSKDGTAQREANQSTN